MLHLLKCSLFFTVFVNGLRNPSDIGIRPQDEITIGPSVSCDDIGDCEGETHFICGTNGKTYNSKCDFERAFCKERNFKFSHFGACSVSEKCRGHRKSAIEEAKLTKGVGVFIPECRPDGSYASIQCHEGTKFCWCSSPDGKPLEITVKHNQKPDCPLDIEPPNDGDKTPPSERPKGTTLEKANVSDPSPEILKECDYSEQDILCADAKPTLSTAVENSTGGDLAGIDPLPSALPPRVKDKPRGCQGKKRNRFSKNMIEQFMIEYNRENTSKKGGKTKAVLRWKFNQLDKKKDGKLRRNEYKNLQKLARSHVKPRKCAKKFIPLCDVDKDRKISFKEWIKCFTIVKKSKKKAPMPPPHPPDRSVNEVNLIGMGPVTQPEPCRRELRQAEEVSLGQNTNNYVPKCDDKGYYEPIQCYGSADKKLWYCFCVDIQTGDMIENTSVQNDSPNCPLTSRRKPWPDCPAPDPEAKFLKSLTSYLFKFSQTINRKIKTLPGSSEIEIALQKVFFQLDRNKNNFIDKKERRNLKKLIKKERSLWVCGKKIHHVCDINDDNRISLKEFTICILPRKKVSKTPSSGNQVRNGKNPFIEVIKSEDSLRL